MKKILTGFLAILILLSTGCSANKTNGSDSISTHTTTETANKPTDKNEEINKETQAKNEKRKIVTTIFPIYDWVNQIVGDKVDRFDITLLLNSGIDLHNYQPTVKDIAEISDCDMFVYVGGESDAWVDDVIKSARNKDMIVVNLLDVMGDKVKMEEIIEGMEHDYDHTHAHDFSDADIKDRSLTDWAGNWQSVYPLLLDGSLKAVLQENAHDSEGEKTEQDYYDYYERGYKTDIDQIKIENNTLSFTKNNEIFTSDYEYKGYTILTYEEGSRGVRYQFEAIDTTAGTPKFIQFSDHGIEPNHAEHFHIYMGNESFEELNKEMDNWPTYFPAEWDKMQVVDSILAHDHAHEEELDEHVWLSLKNAQLSCRDLAGKIEKLDPENAETYKKNVIEYDEKLASLDQQYQTVVDTAKTKSLLFGDRFPFRYLVDDYGLTYSAAFSGCSAETEASFETIAYLAKKVDDDQLKTVVVIDGSDQSIAKTIIANTANKDQTIVLLDSMQSTTVSETPSNVSYLSIMEENLTALKKALN